MQLKRLTSEGFTLVELLIAMAIFSFLLLVMADGTLQLARIYNSGHQIRDTQESARTIAKQITDDTHTSLAVAVGTENGFNAVCLYQTLQELNTPNTLIGTEYYLTSPSANLITMHRRTVQINYTPPAIPGCGGAAITSDDHTITAPTATVNIFNPVAVPAAAPKLLTIRMSVESIYAQQPGDFTHDSVTGFDTCNAGPGAEYCSITNLQFSALRHSEINL